MLDLGEKLQKFGGISGRHLVGLHETDQVQIAFIVEAGQRNVIRHENNAHGACQPQVRMQFVGRSYFRLDHLEGGDSRDLSSARYRRAEIL